MSGILSVGGAGAVGVSGFYPVQINDSLRFEDGSSAYLNRTPSSAGNQKTWTWSAWVKRGKLAAEQTLFGAYKGGNDYVAIQFDTDDSLNVTYKNISQSGGSLSAQTRRKITNNLFRDVSAWYHIVVKFDSANTNCDIYVNGTEVTSFSVNEEPQNLSFEVNAAQIHYIGTFQNSVTGVAVSYFDGYMSNIHFIDGQALDATSFGETKDGVWIPKSYSGSYGTNGFHLKFNGNSNDTSGNSNNWTANNISAHDYVPDSPTNNFATMNSIAKKSTVTLSEGNLKSFSNDASIVANVEATFGISSGKWYFEASVRSGNNVGYPIIYLADASTRSFNDTNYTGNGCSAYGAPIVNGVAQTRVASLSLDSTSQVRQFAFDFDNGKMWIGKDGTWYNNSGTSFTNSTGPESGNNFNSNSGFNYDVGKLFSGHNDPNCAITFNFGQDSTFAGATTAGGNSDANGRGDFKYAPPSGFLALCSANLPEPTIIDASEYFNTLLWTGNGSNPRTLSGLDFAADFIWHKSRSNASMSSHAIQDSVRGFNTDNNLYTNLTGSETAYPNRGVINSVSSTGFTFNQNASDYSTADGLNENNQTFVAWNWKAGTAFSNSAGSNGATIASSGSVNTDAGFSIVDFTGTGGAATIAHGLSTAPEFIVYKRRNASGDGWIVYHKGITNSQNGGIYLQSPAGYNNDSTLWNNTAPTASVFSVGSYGGVNGENRIAYCFHSVDGYSKVGSYTGNGLANGPFIYTGFRPAWIMIKNLAGGENWQIHDSERDPYNVVTKRLHANTTGEDITSTFMDFVSNGVKCRNFSGGFNSTSATFIYLAFAENPFKYSNAR